MNTTRQCSACFHSQMMTMVYLPEQLHCFRPGVSTSKPVKPFDSCKFFSALHDVKTTEKAVA